MKQITLAAIVLTKNEERDLRACLESMEGLATEIYVIDSGSTHRTIAIAQEYGAQVLSHPFTSHAAQFNWALENLRRRSGSCESTLMRGSVAGNGRNCRRHCGKLPRM
jgi:glycosyltransferase involved in cell wall biosynthesis